MFFSVIIPTYNPLSYIKTLLNSILQNDCKDEIEVIISDDLSTEDLSGIIDEYQKYLHLIKIENEQHFGAPMYGRQNGTEIATGEWICFADQDDYFEPGAFDFVKNEILKNNVKNYLVTDFYQRDINGIDIIIEYKQSKNWTHGKFYQKSFWDKYNIHYTETMYCEDILLSVQIDNLIEEEELDNWYLPYVTYNWVTNPNSLSHENDFTQLGYFYLSLPDYLKGSLGVYIDKLKNKPSERMINYYIENTIEMIFLIYFYIQGLLYQNKISKHDADKLDQLVIKYLTDFLQIQEWTFEDLLNNFKKRVNRYNELRTGCTLQIPMIETEPFFHWITRLYKDIK